MLRCSAEPVLHREFADGVTGFVAWETRTSPDQERARQAVLAKALRGELVS